jgi:hypothetical protein
LFLRALFRSRFLQFRGAYATARHPLVDSSTTAAISAALKKARRFNGRARVPRSWLPRASAKPNPR